MSTNAGYLYIGATRGSTTISFPWPDRGSAAFTTTRAVNAARNANNEFVGEQVGRSVDKQSMSWSRVSCVKWWEINNFLESNGLIFWCHYFNHNLGRWMDRQFYAGDPSCQPHKLIDDTVGYPDYYENCSLNVIDTGVGD